MTQYAMQPHRMSSERPLENAEEARDNRDDARQRGVIDWNCGRATWKNGSGLSSHLGSSRVARRVPSVCYASANAGMPCAE